MLRRFFVVVDFSQVGFGLGAPFDATFGVRRAGPVRRSRRRRRRRRCRFDIRRALT